MDGREELHRLVDLLSPYECEQLAGVVGDVAAGERFWEEDVAVFYNEYVKARGDLGMSGMAVVPMSEDGIFSPIPVTKSYPDAERVALPQPEFLVTGFTELVLQRRSVRDYTGAPLSAVQLATLLRHGCGATGAVAAYDYRRLPLRVFPSAGGLQSPEVYVLVLSVAGVAPGFYHYQPLDHVLERLSTRDFRGSLGEIAFSQPGVEQASALFAVTGCYERLRWKYGPRAYRYMCLDAGFMSENIQLAGQSLGLGVCAIAGFADARIEEMVGSDGDEMALLLISVGVPKAPAMPPWPPGSPGGPPPGAPPGRPLPPHPPHVPPPRPPGR